MVREVAVELLRCRSTFNIQATCESASLDLRQTYLGTCGSNRMWEQFGDLLQRPTRRRYLSLRQSILSGDPDHRDRRWLDELSNLARQAEYQSAVELMDQMNDAWALSPAFHAFSAIVLKELGQLEDAESEAFLRLRCVQGLAAAGDGSAEDPFPVTYPGDAAELLAHLGFEPARRMLTTLNHDFLDVVETTCGRKIWLQAPDVQTTSPAKLAQQRSS